jgi:DNA polymerase-3 subunit alpha
MGITVLPPDVNHSHGDFVVQDGKIRFALSAIRGCGGGSADAIVAAREKDGPFKDLFDLCERVDPSQCNRSTIETLIRSGAMDCFGARRAQLLAIVDKALQAGAAKLADRRAGQRGLFDDDDDVEAAANPKVDLPDVPELPEKERLQGEKDVLGFYLSAHPLSEHESALRNLTSHTTITMRTMPNRSEVIVGGMISSIKLAHTRNPKPGAPSKYANFDLEDLEGPVRCICWPDGYEQMGQYIEPDAVVLIRGAVDRRDGGDECNLICNEIIPLHEADTKFTTGIRIHLDEQKHSAEHIARIREILRGYPGTREVLFSLRLDTGEVVHLRSGQHKVEIDRQLRDRLDDLLGSNSHRLMIAPPKPNKNVPKKNFSRS